MTPRIRILGSFGKPLKALVLSAVLAAVVHPRHGAAQPCAQLDTKAIEKFLGDEGQWNMLRSFERAQESGTPIGLERAIILTYDHTSACWAAYQASWHPPGRDRRPFALSGFEPLPALDFEFDLNGRPRIFAAAGARVIPLLVRSNSLLYAADRAVTKEADVEGLAELQKLTALLGGSLGGVLTASGSLQPRSYTNTIQTYTSLVESVKVTEPNVGRAPTQGELQALKNLQKHLETLTTSLADDASAWAEVTRPPTRVLSRMTSETAGAIAALQLLEAGLGPAPAQSPAHAVSDTVTAFASLENPSSPAPQPTCVSELQSLLPAIHLAGRKSAEADRVAAAQRLAVSLSLRPKPETCALVPHLNDVAKWLLGVTRLDDDARKEIGLTEGRVLAYVDLATAAAKAADDMAALLKKKADLLGAATSLDAYALRVSRRCPVVNAACSIVAVPGPYAAAKWSKIETAGFTIKAQSEYAGSVTKVRAIDVALSYDVRWYRGSLFGTGFGVTLTSLKNPKFGSVCIAKASGTCADAKRYIGITDEESRSGTIALFGSLRFLQLFNRGARSWAVQPAADIGLGLTTSEPRFFFGGSLQFYRYFRVGGGLTLQKVTRLGVGQSELLVVDGSASPLSTEITSATDIRTRQGFQREGYLSLVIALDDLPIFKN